jgi:hypothetical protein
MSSLFLRTLSQGLQAFIPIAAFLVWSDTFGRRVTSSAIRRGLVFSIPATLIAAWLFRTSEHRALQELWLAASALPVAFAFGLVVWRSPARRSDESPHNKVAALALLTTIAAASALIVVRQTMEIGAVLSAAVELRSFEATSAIVKGAALAGTTAWLLRRFASLVPAPPLRTAVRAFSAAFIAQLVIYTFHESAEARLLPLSDLMHSATEPYGPDGMYGVHFSDLLVLAPLTAIAWSSLGPRLRFRWIRATNSLSRQRAPVGRLIVATVVLMGMQRTDSSRPLPSPGASATDIAAVVAKPHVLFRSTSPGSNYGRLSVAALDSLDHRSSTVVPCERISFAAERGLCLHTERSLFNTHTAFLLDRSLTPGVSIKLEGLPSRTRIAADGRVGAITVFVVGDDYASSFSTRTRIFDGVSGDEIGELEQFATWRNNARFRAVDFNFWGVTFARDDNTFYASLGTAGVRYLVRGELALRKLTVLRDNVECPSLSPDNRLLAYKKRVGPGPETWRLHVLDLTTNVEQIIGSETRYIDDQVEWLDARHVLYGVPRRTTAITDVWVAPIDGSAPAAVFLPEAESPIVIR